MTEPRLRVAPLDDEQLLAAVQQSIRSLILPELERLGAEEFTLSQVRATLSIVNFVRRGLVERAVADAELRRRAGEGGPAAESPLDPELRRLLLERLEVEVRSRSGAT